MTSYRSTISALLPSLRGRVGSTRDIGDLTNRDHSNILCHLPANPAPEQRELVPDIGPSHVMCELDMGEVAMWVCGDGVDVEALAFSVQDAVENFEPGIWRALEYAPARTALDPSVFGGLAIAVTASGIEWLVTGRWLSEDPDVGCLL